MIILIHLFKKIAMLILFIALFGLIGCKGTETRENVDDTVEELVGKKNVDRMNKMKKDIKQIQDQDTERLNQLDDEE